MTTELWNRKDLGPVICLLFRLFWRIFIAVAKASERLISARLDILVVFG